MKAMNINRIIALCALVLLPAAGMAQNEKRGFANVDWQFNIPLSNGFSDKASGWGMNIEGGYYFENNIGIGLFFAYHTNNEYIGTRTLQLSESSSLTTDQQHSLYQLPFGASIRYRFMPDKLFVPYVAMKVGPEYSRAISYYNVYDSSSDKWGFFLSPEIGATIYPMRSRVFGFHIALYYAYATNQNKVLIYNMDGLSNLGFRVGLAF